MKFYFPGERHTLASALRVELELGCPEEFVACTLVHPLDSHLEVEAPSEADLRAALLRIKDHIRNARRAPCGQGEAPARSDGH